MSPPRKKPKSARLVETNSEKLKPHGLDTGDSGETAELASVLQLLSSAQEEPIDNILQISKELVPKLRISNRS